MLRLAKNSEEKHNTNINCYSFDVYFTHHIFRDSGNSAVFLVQGKNPSDAAAYGDFN